MSTSAPQEKTEMKPQDAERIADPVSAQSPADARPEPAQPLTGMAKWVHEHRHATDKPAGFIAYQVVRNMLAAIPYGFATIATWAGFEKIAKVTEGAEKGYFTSGAHKLAKSPLRDIAMIAAGFTLYRGTLKWVRYTKERLFNADHTEEQTKQAVDNFASNLKADFKEIAPAEMNSTPYGAIALGLGRRYLDGMKDYQNRDAAYKVGHSVFRNLETGKLQFGSKNFKALFDKVLHPKSMPWSEAGIFIASFLAFFELSDRLFKDTQIRRGIWNGEHNSLARVSPEKEAIRAEQEKEQGLDKDAGYHMAKHGVGQNPKLFTGDPNLARLMMTRVVSTALGIGAYTLTKRAAYATMGHFTKAPTFLGKVAIEGAATANFFTMSSANDAVESIYKKWSASKEKTPIQQKNHEALMAQLNAKERGHAMA